MADDDAEGSKNLPAKSDKSGIGKRAKEFGEYLIKPVKDYFLDIKREIDDLRKDQKKIASAIEQILTRLNVIDQKLVSIEDKIDSIKDDMNRNFDSAAKNVGLHVTEIREDIRGMRQENASLMRDLIGMFSRK